FRIVEELLKNLRGARDILGRDCHLAGRLSPTGGKLWIESLEGRLSPRIFFRASAAADVDGADAWVGGVGVLGPVDGIGRRLRQLDAALAVAAGHDDQGADDAPQI